MRTSLIIAMLIIIVWESLQVVRLEKYHYVNAQGFCGQANLADASSVKTFNECVAKSQTKTPIFYLFSGLTGSFTSD